MLHLPQGSWINDMQQGRGSMVYADGTTYKGLWHKAMRNGQGECWYACALVGLLVIGSWFFLST